MRCYAILIAVLLLTAGCGGQAGNAEPAEGEPRSGNVEAMDPFWDFIAERPTPEEFRRVYPDVVLVLPDDVATQEYRTDNSRFFAKLDEEGRIKGGAFR